MNKISRYIWLNIKPYRIIRDVILVKLFAFICSGLADYTASDAVGQNFSMVISGIIGTLIMMSIGLSIVGAINPKNRWFHLAIVTALIFAVSCLTSGSISLINALCFLGFYVVGGLLSMLYPVFRNRETVEPSLEGDKVDNEQGGE
jgi:hypothetical protein